MPRSPDVHKSFSSLAPPVIQSSIGHQRTGVVYTTLVVTVLGVRCGIKWTSRGH
jgi:hypothetical protein